MKKWCGTRGWWPYHSAISAGHSTVIVSEIETRYVVAKIPSEPIALLWALALEIDERGATFTGGRVCRACGGSGATIVGVRGIGQRAWSVAQCLDHRLTLHGVEPAEVLGGYCISRDYAVATTPCPCDGPTRPETVSLHRLVADLAKLSRPAFAWPPGMHIAADLSMHAGGWQARWWDAFLAWSVRGVEPDADALAADLEALLREREAFPRDAVA